jgi:hypothetical protein
MWGNILSHIGMHHTTGHVAPDQARFGPEYFLAFTLPDCKPKVLPQLLDAQKEDGQTLFNLMGQCFQDVGLTKWTSIVTKQYPIKADHTQMNFDKCIRDYLGVVAGFPNVGDQLIGWLHTAKKPALILMHEFMWRQVQLVSYLKNGYIHLTIELPMAEEKGEQIFFAQPKANQFKFAETNKMVTTDLHRLIAFFKQCQAANILLAFLRRLTRTRSSQKRRRRLISPLRAAMI